MKARQGEGAPARGRREARGGQGARGQARGQAGRAHGVVHRRRDDAAVQQKLAGGPDVWVGGASTPAAQKQKKHQGVRLPSWHA